MENLTKSNRTQRLLAQVIDDTLHVNISTSSRKRETVNGRMIYYKILDELKFGCSSIGKSINKNHATVLHGLKQFKDLWVTDKHLREDYYLIRELFYSHDDAEAELTYSRKELFKTVKNLQKENKCLSLEIEQLNNRLNRYKKYQELLDVLDKRKFNNTQLHQIKIKLNHFVNGV